MPRLACRTGAYVDPAVTIDPRQTYNDPFANAASATFACLRPANAVYLPLQRRR